MSREKQIEEMAEVIEEASCGYGVDGCHRCEFAGKGDISCAEMRIAKALYNAGYRKQSENTVEVIRCKDCEYHHWEQEPCHGKTIHKCSVLNAEVFKDFYCYHGKPKMKGGAE